MKSGGSASARVPSGQFTEELSFHDMAELREVKVKLPVEQILQLHYVRMKSRRNFSDVMSAALREYMLRMLDDNGQPTSADVSA